MVMVVRAELLNAPSPMLSTLLFSANVTVARESQYAKAKSQTLVTLSGIVTVVRLVP